MREALARLSAALDRLNCAPFPTPSMIRESVEAAHAAIREVAARVEHIERRLNDEGRR